MRDKYLVSIYYKKGDKYPEEFKYAQTESDVYDICLPYAMKGYYCTYQTETGREKPVEFDERDAMDLGIKARGTRRRRTRRESYRGNGKLRIKE